MLLDLSAARLARFKAEARRLREGAGPGFPHSQALEAVAHRNGARDWNTLQATARRPVRLAVGDRVAGRYLGHPVFARVHAVQATPNPGRLRLTLHLDQPVDVVTFESFSAYRQRIRAMIGPDGRTAEKTSDGIPHLELIGLQPAPTQTETPQKIRIPA